jgi:hypothetical protein
MLCVAGVLSWALAVEPELVVTRAKEADALRSTRLDKGAPVLPQDVFVRAAKGEIVTGLVAVDGYAAKKAWGVGVFDVPIGRFWAAVNDDQSKVEVTQLDYAEILQGKLCDAPRRVFQFLPVPLMTDRWWIIDVRYNDALFAATQGRIREQTWSTNGDWTVPTSTAKAWADQGMHINSTVGSWVLVDLDGKHTLVEYYTWADAGGSIPASIASSFAASGVDNTLTTLADLARKGTRCPIK